MSNQEAEVSANYEQLLPIVHEMLGMIGNQKITEAQIKTREAIFHAAIPFLVNMSEEQARKFAGVIMIFDQELTSLAKQYEFGSAMQAMEQAKKPE